MNASKYQKHLLAVLLVILASNNVDRLALGLVLQDIKADFFLSDTQLGLLSGIAFSLFYAVMGIPIARWADRGSRVTIITLTTALWSAAVALCAIAGNFVQLLLIRVAVAVGEAGCVPPAHSLIADEFPRAERPRATAIYMLGTPLSVVIGYFIAGWLDQMYGWRVTFMLIGSPGLLLAVLAWLTLREPRRQLGNSMSQGVAAISRQPSLKAVFQSLWRSASFRHLLFSFSVAYFFSSGLLQWQPTFFMRSYGLQSGELGTWFALIYGLGGILGMYWGGQWASRRAARNEALQLRAVAFAYSIFGVLSIFVYLSPHYGVAFALMAAAAMGIAATYGPLFATVQTLVPPQMRAMSIALIYLFANFIGLGLGPLAAGALSDAFRPWAGEESLRYALLALCPGYWWAGWHLWRASKTVSGDLIAAEARYDRLPTREMAC